MADNVYSTFGAFYRVSTSLFGFNRALLRYIRQLDLSLDPHSNILELGAGPSPMSISLLERCPGGRLVITDFDEGFLDIISKKFTTSIQSGRIQVKKVDINFLPVTEWLATFDIIITGGVLGYSKSLPKIIQDIWALLKENGVFINVEMSPNLLGPMYAKMYSSKLPKSELITNYLQDSHYNNIEIKKIPVKYFPLNLSRQIIIARKFRF